MSDLSRSIPASAAIHCVSFNQDSSCFTFAHSHGFSVFQTDPLHLKMNRMFEPLGDLQLVQMLYLSNVIAFVGTGGNPKFPNTKVVLWNEQTGRILTEITTLSPILNLRLRKDRMAIVLKNKVLVYSMTQIPIKLAEIETCSNPLGLVALSVQEEGPIVLATPGRQEGYVQLTELNDTPTKATFPMINAHESALGCISLNRDGSLLATASEKVRNERRCRGLWSGSMRLPQASW